MDKRSVGEYEELHILNVPEDIVPRINRHNRENRQNKVNITQVCVDALRKAMKKQGVI